MSHAGTEDKFLLTLFPENMEKTRVLDVGCGYGETGLYIRTHSYKKGWCRLEGIEIFPEYYQLQLKLGIYDTLYLGNAIHTELPDNTYDLCVAQQVIEHLTKRDGYKLLTEMTRITKGRVIVCTPHGFMESGPLDGNIHNDHLSAWYPKDFTEKGWRVKIVTKNVNSRALMFFAKLWFRLRGQTWDSEVIVAWKDC